MVNNVSVNTILKKLLLLPLVILPLLSFALMGCGGGSPLTLTQANLDRVHNDMSPSEVKSVLGEPTESKTDPIPLVGGIQTTFTYSNSTSQVTIVFKNDKVMEKHGSFGP